MFKLKILGFTDSDFFPDKRTCKNITKKLTVPKDAHSKDKGK